MENATKVPVNVYAEMTPNPATMKFVSDLVLVNSNDVVEFNSTQEAKGYSPLAEALFNFPFVKGIFITANFVTVTKTNSIEWDYITMELREFVRDFLSNGKEAVTKIPEPKPKEEQPERELSPAEPSEFDDKIVQLLEEYVRPAVERDGGAIHFHSFKDGIVTVVLKGACSGCPSSTATLKGGIEVLLKDHIKEVKAVVAEEL